MITVGIDPKQLESIRQSLGAKANRLSREVATAINATAKKVRFEASKALQKELKVPSKVLKKAIKTKSNATKDQLQAIIRLWKGYPIPLKYYGATEVGKPKKAKGKKKPKGSKTKKPKTVGVTYRINPGHKVKSILRDAFIVKQYGGNVYRRVGANRWPIKQVYGPSPGDAFEAAGIGALAAKVAASELPKQLGRRIRFLMLQTSGGLRGNSAGRVGKGNQ
jgi:hypothetical protein